MLTKIAFFLFFGMTAVWYFAPAVRTRAYEIVLGICAAICAISYAGGL